MELGIDAVSAVLILGATIASVEFIKALFDRDWRSAAIILGAGIVGGFAGLSTGYTFIVGVVAGLTGSGIITISQNIGK